MKRTSRSWPSHVHNSSGGGVIEDWPAPRCNLRQGRHRSDAGIDFGAWNLLHAFLVLANLLLVGGGIGISTTAHAQESSAAQDVNEKARRDRAAAIEAATVAAQRARAAKEAERAVLPPSKPNTMVGVLDQQQCAATPEEEKDGELPITARLLFARIGKRWVALNQRHDDPLDPDMDRLDLQDTRWTVAFDGRNLGEVRLAAPKPPNPSVKEWYFARDNKYQLLDPQSVPMVRNRQGEFGGWCATPTFRPLVIVSQPNFEDPDRWQPFKPSGEMKSRLLVAVKVRIGRLNEKRWPKGKDEGVPIEIKESDLVFHTSFRSKSGRQLISIGIDPGLLGEPDGPLDAGLSPAWFLVDGESIDYLGNQMMLVDAGDYGGDGESELLFWHAGYDNNGYVLYYGNFYEKSEFLWSYH